VVVQVVVLEGEGRIVVLLANIAISGFDYLTCFIC
jgi:hypothetical protein